jgi:hypothetical protein
MPCSYKRLREGKMKRLLSVILAFSCTGSWLLGQSGTIKSPKAFDVWTLGGQSMIQWTFSGSAKVKLQLFDPNGKKLGPIKSGLQLNAGSFLWTVGKLESGQMVPAAKGYKIQLIRTDGGTTVLDKGAGPFEIVSASVIPPAPIPPGNPPNQMVVLNPKQTIVPGPMLSLRKKIVVHSPKGGDAWKPLSSYAVTWEAAKNQYPASAYEFNVRLVGVSNPAFTPLVLKQGCWATAKQTSGSNIYSFDWKFLGSMSIPSGKYKVAVQSTAIPDFKGESGVISVQNSMAGSTAFLGEDEPDFKIEDVYYDVSKKSMWVRIKNQGFSSYAGPLTINYNFKLASVTYGGGGCASGDRNGETKIPSITLNKFQSNAYLICKWPCFDKRPADYFPITGPVKYQVLVSATGKDPASQSGVICKSKVPDVIVDDSFQLQGKYDPDYLPGFQQVSLDPRDFNWISGNAFEAKVSVRVRNWGCQGVSCIVTLSADGNYLDGKRLVTLGIVNLPSGKETTFVSGTVKFSIPKDNQYHKLLLVAHQAEANGEGYPDAYKNNFILTHLRLKEKSNTVRGNGL